MATTITGTTAPIIAATAPITGATAPIVAATAPIVAATAPITGVTAPVTGATAAITGVAAPITGVTAPITGGTAAVIDAEEADGHDGHHGHDGHDGISAETVDVTTALLHESADVHNSMMDDGYEYHVATGGMFAGTAGTAGTAPATGAATTTGATTLMQGSDNHHNYLEAGSDDAVLHAGSSGDVLVGGSGSNTLIGNAGDDIMIGGAANSSSNIINGGGGNNTLVAAGPLTQQMDDFLNANQGMVNTLLADPKMASIAALANSSVNNTAAGTSSTFQLQSGSSHDSIYNFHADTDVVQIQSGINGSEITDIASLLSHTSISGNNLSIDLGAGSTVTLVGVDVQHLTAMNVSFG